MVFWLISWLTVGNPGSLSRGVFKTMSSGVLRIGGGVFGVDLLVQGAWGRGGVKVELDSGFRGWEDLGRVGVDG